MEGDGTLLCSYHGWRFDSGGKCTTIPQVSSPAAPCVTGARWSHRFDGTLFMPLCHCATAKRHIPKLSALVQANEEKTESAACASSRSCVKSFPVQVQPSILCMQSQMFTVMLHLLQECGSHHWPDQH